MSLCEGSIPSILLSGISILSEMTCLGKNPCCLKTSVKFPQSVVIWAAMSSAGVGSLCYLKSTVNAAIYQDILEHFMLPSADKLHGDADIIL